MKKKIGLAILPLIILAGVFYYFFKTPNSSAQNLSGTIITIFPGDSYAKIEAANPGDTVLIAPGTYNFRVTLSKAATADAPIIIKAQDPANRPVFDYTGRKAEKWPGSYNGGDAYRGCWFIRSPAAYYTIDGIIIQGCHGIDGNSGGIRYLKSSHLTIKNSFFQLNENGIIGGGSETVVESCEFDQNGNTGNDQNHNIYVLGGDRFKMRYSYLHDSRGEGQNFHIRARNSVLEYNWFERAGGYEGDIMSPSAIYDVVPSTDNVQKILLLGNVFVTKRNAENDAKVFAMFNDNHLADFSMELTALWNTFYITQPKALAAAVQVRNDGLASAKIIFSNNIVAGGGRLFVLLGTPLALNYSISGTNNWFTTGSNVKFLTKTILGSDPGFTNAAGLDFTLTLDGSALSAADTSIIPHPVASYKPLNFFTERINVNDIGAYEYVSLAPTDATSPARSAGSPSGFLASGAISTTMSLSTNENATCKYSSLSGISYSAMTSNFSTTGATNHSITISGLQNGQTYSYYVKCVDTKNNANPDDLTISFSVSQSSANIPPVVSLSANTTSGSIPLKVDFTGTASDPDGTIASYAWNFGDGASSREQNSSHTYTSAGVYTAILTVTDNVGATKTSQVTITATSSLPPPTGNTYYVRPAGGNYGSENGASYQNAWDGYANINWNTLGANLPSTLYVCGSQTSQLTVQAGGTGENSRLTIRGDCPNDPAMLNGGGTATYGIYVESYDYVTIKEFNITRFERGIGFRQWADYGVIENNKVDLNGRWGIYTATNRFTTIANNICSNSVLEHGIYLANDSDDAVIRGNTCFGNGRTGIQLNGDGYIQERALVEKNIIYNNALTFDFSCVHDSVIRNNLIYNAPTKGMALWDTSLGAGYGCENNKIINNTIHVSSGASREGILIRKYSTGNTIANNIIYTYNAPAIIVDNLSTTGTVMNNNQYYNTASSQIEWAGQGYSLANFKSAIGQDLNSKAGDPLFVNLSSGDFHLQANSPSLDAGANSYAPSDDMEGKTRPSGLAADMGAYEYQSALVLPSITLTKSADKTEVQSGDAFTYTFTYRNTTSSSAKNIVITDPIPQGTSYVIGSATSGGVYDAANNRITWTIPALSGNTSGAVSFRVTVE